jgi:hypothetical protein
MIIDVSITLSIGVRYCTDIPDIAQIFQMVPTHSGSIDDDSSNVSQTFAVDYISGNSTLSPLLQRRS